MASPFHPSPNQVLRIHCVKVFVRDQEQSLRFYLEQLGFRLVADNVLQSGERWLAVAPPEGETVIALVAPAPDSHQYQLIGRHTDVVFVTDDVVSRYREWSSRGVKFLGVPKLRRVKSTGPSVPSSRDSTVWGGVFTSFRDIDGNSFSLVSFDEVTHAIEAQRRALAEKAERERRLAQEIEIAKQVQAHLFPQELPVVQTLDYAGTCLQARHVGGDYYDILALGRDRYGFVIGDIAGKGIAAALLMANLQANLRSQCATAVDELERLLQSINRLFCDNTPDNAYATFFFSEYDDRAQHLRYANCGHLAGLLLRRDESVDRLEPTATVLGLFKDWDCSVQHRKFFAGDILVLYTDGVTEACDASGVEFGEDRLIDCLIRRKNMSAQALVSCVLDEVRRYCPHEQQDDITLVVAKCKQDETRNQMGLPYDWSV